MSQNVIYRTRGIGFLQLLTVLFVGLKLTGYITWSWLWVLSPLWIGVALMLAILLGGAILTGLLFAGIAIIDAIRNARRKSRLAMG